jgi:hypothetical protein
MSRILSAKPKILNVSMPVSGDEYSQIIPSGTLRFTFRSRFGGTLQVYFETGSVDYIEVPSGSSFSEYDIKTVEGLTLYAISTKNNDVLEMLLWV